MRLPFGAKRPQQKAGYSSFETLISDRRMEAIANLLRDQFRPLGLTDDADFVTFIQPATTVERGGVHVPIPEVACFAVISDNPRHSGHRVMTQASVWLKDWLAKDAARLHFVSGKDDPALPIFRYVVRDHLPKIQNLKDMI